MDLTPDAVKALDVLRHGTMGTGFDTITLLKHASAGYTRLVDVSTGWSIKISSAGEIGVGGLLICEQGDVTADLIEGANAIALNGLVWKIDGPSRLEPLGANFKVWAMDVRRTDEPFEAEDFRLLADGSSKRLISDNSSRRILASSL